MKDKEKQFTFLSSFPGTATVFINFSPFIFLDFSNSFCNLRSSWYLATAWASGPSSPFIAELHIACSKEEWIIAKSLFDWLKDRFQKKGKKRNARLGVSWSQRCLRDRSPFAGPVPAVSENLRARRAGSQRLSSSRYLSRESTQEEQFYDANRVIRFVWNRSRRGETLARAISESGSRVTRRNVSDTKLSILPMTRVSVSKMLISLPFFIGGMFE